MNRYESNALALMFWRHWNHLVPGFASALFEPTSHGVPLISAAYYNHTTMGGSENVHD